MRETMEKMEQERAEMVAEVEAQIERALQSMAVGMDESDYSSSRSQSRLSDVSAPQSRSQSRRASDASKSRHLRSFGTESTLAESYGEDIEAADAEDATIAPQKITRETGTIVEDDEEDHTATKKKRFSASDMEAPQDGMNAVDEGISQKSDKIAQKVLEIQQKVCTAPVCSSLLSNIPAQLELALASERRGPKWKSNVGAETTEEELSEVGSNRSKRSRGKRVQPKITVKPRARSDTSSTNTSTGAPTINLEREKEKEGKRLTPAQQLKATVSLASEPEAKTPTRDSFLDVDHDDQVTPEPITPPEVVETASTIRKVAPSVPTGMTDDSDTDFQSAYSTSPRGSYGSLGSDKNKFVDTEDDTTAASTPIAESIEDRLSAPPKTRRQRVSSTSTATVKRETSEPRLNLAPNSLPSRSRVVAKQV